MLQLPLGPHLEALLIAALLVAWQAPGFRPGFPFPATARSMKGTNFVHGLRKTLYYRRLKKWAAKKAARHSLKLIRLRV